MPLIVRTIALTNWSDRSEPGAGPASAVWAPDPAPVLIPGKLIESQYSGSGIWVTAFTRPASARGAGMKSSTSQPGGTRYPASPSTLVIDLRSVRARPAPVHAASARRSPGVDPNCIS